MKSADPTARIGGPSLMFAFNGPGYEDGFLDFLRQQQLPLDFWTFHDYCINSADPYYYVRVAQHMRDLLDRHGFATTELMLDEWNVLGLDLDLLTMAGRAAFTASAIIHMQDSPVDEQTFYMGPNLFGEDGATPNKVGQALVALGRFKATPLRLPVLGGDTEGFAVQAGRSEDGQEMTVLLSRYEVPVGLRGPRVGGDRVADMVTLLPRRELSYDGSTGARIRLRGLEPGIRYRLERYRVSDTWDLRLLNTEWLEGPEATFEDTLPAPSIALYQVRRDSV